MDICRRRFGTCLLGGLAGSRALAVPSRPKLLVLIVVQQFRPEYLDASQPPIGRRAGSDACWIRAPGSPTAVTPPAPSPAPPSPPWLRGAGPRSTASWRNPGTTARPGNRSRLPKTPCWPPPYARRWRPSRARGLRYSRSMPRKPACSPEHPKRASTGWTSTGRFAASGDTPEWLPPLKRPPARRKTRTTPSGWRRAHARERRPCGP